MGELRFRAPVPPVPWTAVRDARQFGPTPPQLLSIMRDLAPQSEDCLLRTPDDATLEFWSDLI